MPFLDDLIGVHDIQVNGGAALPRRAVLNVIGTGVTAVDNPNTGATDLTLPTTVAGSTVTPFQLLTSTNDYAPAGVANAAVQRWTAAGPLTVTGLVFGTGYLERPVIMNVGPFAITLAHQSTSSATSNRFVCPGNVNYVLGAGGAVELVRDTISDRWRLVS